MNGGLSSFGAGVRHPNGTIVDGSNHSPLNSVELMNHNHNSGVGNSSNSLQIQAAGGFGTIPLNKDK